MYLVLDLTCSYSDDDRLRGFQFPLPLVLKGEIGLLDHLAFHSDCSHVCFFKSSCLKYLLSLHLAELVTKALGCTVLPSQASFLL